MYYSRARHIRWHKHDNNATEQNSCFLCDLWVLSFFSYLATHSHSLSICSASGKYYKWFTLGSDSMHGDISAHSKCNGQVNRAFVELAYRKALAFLCCVLDIFWAIFIVK